MEQREQLLALTSGSYTPALPGAVHGKRLRMDSSFSTLRALDAARATFASAQLAAPPVPGRLVPELREVSNWCFSTLARALTDEFHPYNFGQYVSRLARSIPDDFILVAHSGHGINSYAIQYYLVYRPIVVYFQIPFGGVYGDLVAERAKVNKCFELTGQLVELVDKTRSSMEPEYLIPMIANEFDVHYSIYPPYSLAGHQLLPLNGLDQQASIEESLQFTLEYVRDHDLTPKTTLGHYE